MLLVAAGRCYCWAGKRMHMANRWTIAQWRMVLVTPANALPKAVSVKIGDLVQKAQVVGARMGPVNGPVYPARTCILKY